MLEPLKKAGKTTDPNGADLLLDTLTSLGVDMIFGYPGGTVLPIYDSLYRKSFNNILVRHEQGAIHAAEGYAKSSGKPGVVLVTSGPGATNVITGIADAKIDSVPLVVFTGQVPHRLIGTNAFQETDIVSIAKPITKATFQLSSFKELDSVVKEAFEIANHGRKGPVIVDLPKDVMETDVLYYEQTTTNNQYNTDLHFDSNTLKLLDAELAKAKHPLLLVGGGVMAAGAANELREFVNQHQIPVVSSLLGLGLMSHDNPQFLGMAGMHGSYAANMALSQCDFLLNIGSRFDDRLVTNPANFAPNAFIAHIDIDAKEFNKIIPADLTLLADAKQFLNRMLEATPSLSINHEWNSRIDEWKESYPYHYAKDSNNGIKPQEVIKAVGEITNGDAIVVTDVGQHKMWAAQYYPYKHPRQLITSGGLGTMGYGLPAAIGAKLANPHKEVVLFVGDGGFQMTMEELGVIQQYHLDIKIILFNNHTLGMVKQWQDLFYEKRYSQTVFNTQPNFQTIAQSYDINHMRLSPSNWREELSECFENAQGTLVEIPISKDEEVTPMIIPGSSNDEMINFD